MYKGLSAKAKVLLGVCLIILAILFYVGSQKYSHQHDLLINLSANMVTIGVTVFFVDYIFEKGQRRRWESAQRIAKEDITSLSNGMVSYISSPIFLGAGVLKEWLARMQETTEGDGSTVDELIDWDIQKIQEVGSKELLSKLSTDMWTTFDKSVKKLEVEMRDTIMLYKDVLPPEILGKLFEINKYFKDAYSLFGSTIGVILYTIKQGKEQKTTEIILDNFSRDLDEYLVKVKEFRELIKKTSWN